MSSLFLPLKNQVTLNNLLILSSEAHLLLSILKKTVHPILIWKFPFEGLKHLRIWFWCYHKKLNCSQTSIILYKMIIAILYTLKKKNEKCTTGVSSKAPVIFTRENNKINQNCCKDEDISRWHQCHSSPFYLHGRETLISKKTRTLNWKGPAEPWSV